MLTPFETVPSTDIVDHEDINFTCPISASTLLTAYQTLLDQRNRQKVYTGILLTLVVVGCAAIFGTAFNNCSKIDVINDSPSTLYPLYAEPFGTKINSLIWFPDTDLEITLNGINSYADVTLSNNQVLHFSNYGKKGNLKHGPDNYAIEPGFPRVVFWVCNQRYEKTSPDRNTTSNVDTLGNYISYTRTMSDYFTLTTNTTYLRGSSTPKITPLINNVETLKIHNTRFSFYNPTQPTEPVKSEEKLNLSI